MSLDEFTRELNRLMDETNNNQSTLARKGVGSAAMIGSWVRGETPRPDPERVFAVERALGVDPGHLSHYLGFVPATDSLATLGLSVMAAIDADPNLDDADKDVMRLMYKTLRGRTSGGRSDPDSRPTAGELRQRLDRVTGRGAGPRRERPA